MDFLTFHYIAIPNFYKMSNEKQTPSIFSKENYMWMLIGLVVIALGMVLMSGGASNKNPNNFDADAVYSARRITIAPILILAGLVIEIWAIFKKPKTTEA
jgi:FtsH-binding integral membrane protein